MESGWRRRDDTLGWRSGAVLCKATGDDKRENAHYGGANGEKLVNKQDQQAIDELFRHLYQAAGQAGPRDEAAEALIEKYIRQGPSGLHYHMAQTLVAQQGAIRQLRAQIAAARQQGGSAGFAQPGNAQPGYGQPGYAQPGYAQPGYGQPVYQQQSRGGGFLAGAGQIALGVGGGILGAELLTSMFDGAGDLFGGGRDEYADGYQEGFAAGDDQGRDDQARDDQGRDDYAGQDPGGYDNQGYDNQGYDDQGYDDQGFDGGGFDGGGFDDGSFL